MSGPAGPEPDRTLSEPLTRQISEILDRAEEELIRAATTTPHGGRKLLDRELVEIKDEVIAMGGLVEEAIRQAIEALVEHDGPRATAVIAGDRRINEMQRRISGLITTAIATQSPVARDLRYLIALDHVTSELERMGDHAGSVAKQARKLAPQPSLRPDIDLPQMGELVATQVNGVLNALVTVDEAHARLVAAGDDDVDALYHRLFEELLSLMRADPSNVDRATRLLFAAHYLERIGDRATNIAEDVVFLASGEIEDLNP